MRQVQITLPKKYKSDAKEILEDYTSDFSSSKVEKNERKDIEFTATVEADEIDELSEELKDIDDIESGELSIRVIKQQSLIRKGQETRGGDSMLSQAEIYSRAQEDASFSASQWGLIGLSSVIAAYGVATANLIVVVGAMMLAPILSPFISGALSLVVGDRSLMLKSFKYGVLSVLAAITISFVAVLPIPVTTNGTLQLVATPSLTGVVLSLFVGAAAALTFSTGLRDEIAGVAVAIALVPPIASVGIGLKLADLNLALDALTVAVVNMTSVLVSGFVTFYAIGLRPSTYYKERQAEKMRYIVPVALVFLGLLTLPIAYSSYQGYQKYVVEDEIRQEAENFFGPQLLEAKVDDSKATLYVIGEFNKTEFERKLSRDVEIRLIQMKRIN